MKIKAEELAKIIEEEVYNIMQEVWMPGQTMDKIAGLYSKLGPLKEPKAQAAGKPEEKPILKTMSGSDLEKNLKILMGQTNPLYLWVIREYLDLIKPEEMLARLVKVARIDEVSFLKEIQKFIEKMENYTTPLKEDLKQDLLRKRNLISNIEVFMEGNKKFILRKLMTKIVADIKKIKQDLKREIWKNRGKLSPANIQIFNVIKKEGSEEWLLKEIGSDVEAVVNSLILITKQTILNAHAQKDIPG